MPGGNVKDRACIQNTLGNKVLHIQPEGLSEQIQMNHSSLKMSKAISADKIEGSAKTIETYTLICTIPGGN